MSRLVTVRLAAHIDRSVKGHVIVGECGAVIASGLLQNQFVWLSLGAGAQNPEWGNVISPGDASSASTLSVCGSLLALE